MNNDDPILASMRNTIRTAGIVNLCLALLLCIGTFLAVDWAGVVLMDRYGEMYDATVGIISYDRLEQFHGGMYVDSEFALLKGFLLRNVWWVLLFFPTVVSILLAANGVFLLVRSRRIRKRAVQGGEASHSEPAGDQ